MDIIYHVLLFFVSIFLLMFSGRWLIESLKRIAKFLGWKEFVVAFFILAFGSSLPNLFVGILSALNRIPQLSLGDVLGANIFDLTVVVALATFISRQGISAPSRTVQVSSIFTIGAAILPLILISDRKLSQSDGFLLILVFVIYVYWLFKEEDRFKKIYDDVSVKRGYKYFLKDLLMFLGSFIMIFLGARGIVKSASFFATRLNLPLIFIGIFVVGISDCLPETFFSIRAARHSQDWMILGNIMGSVMITATLVLGVTALIYPIEVCPVQICPINKFFDFSIIAISRLFLIISAAFFLIFLRTGRKITRKEAIFLLLVYIIFFLVQYLMR